MGSSFPFLVLSYFALFGAYGSESPFFPSFLASRNLTPSEISFVLASGTVIRLISGPVVGNVADAAGTRRVLALSALSSSVLILLYLGAHSFLALLAVSLAHSLVTAPLNPLADALALEACARDRTYPYAWIRGIGSAAFIAGTLASGELIARFSLSSIQMTAAILFAALAAAVSCLPGTPIASTSRARHGFAIILANRPFRRLLIVAGLISGSHAMSDAFAVLHWRLSGLGTRSVSVLWSEAVVGELIVFFWAGPKLMMRLGAARCAALSALAGALRWGVIGTTVALPALAMVQLLHGLTFSLMHLVCMDVIRRTTPAELAGTAQTLYGSFCMGAASALVTLLSGSAYTFFGAPAFWLMSGLCLIALPLAARLEHGFDASIVS